MMQTFRKIRCVLKNTENGLEKYRIQLAHLSHASSIALDAKTLTIFLR